MDNSFNTWYSNDLRAQILIFWCCDNNITIYRRIQLWPTYNHPLTNGTLAHVVISNVWQVACSYNYKLNYYWSVFYHSIYIGVDFILKQLLCTKTLGSVLTVHQATNTIDVHVASHRLYHLSHDCTALFSFSSCNVICTHLHESSSPAPSRGWWNY